MFCSNISDLSLLVLHYPNLFISWNHKVCLLDFHHLTIFSNVMNLLATLLKKSLRKWKVNKKSENLQCVINIKINKDGNGSDVEYGNTLAPVDIMGVCEPAMFFGQNKEPIQEKSENYKDEKGK